MKNTQSTVEPFQIPCRASVFEFYLSAFSSTASRRYRAFSSFFRGYVHHGRLPQENATSPHSIAVMIAIGEIAPTHTLAS